MVLQCMLIPFTIGTQDDTLAHIEPSVLESIAKHQHPHHSHIPMKKFFKEEKTSMSSL